MSFKIIIYYNMQQINVCNKYSKIKCFDFIMSISVFVKFYKRSNCIEKGTNHFYLLLYVLYDVIMLQAFSYNMQFCLSRHICHFLKNVFLLDFFFSWFNETLLYFEFAIYNCWFVILAQWGILLVVKIYHFKWNNAKHKN